MDSDDVDLLTVMNDSLNNGADVSTDVVVIVGGLVITGRLISADLYFIEIGRRMVAGDSSENMKRLADTLREAAKVSGDGWIHLAGARFMEGGRLHGDQKLWLRLKVSAIDGYMPWGSISAEAVPPAL